MIKKLIKFIKDEDGNVHDLGILFDSHNMETDPTKKAHIIKQQSQLKKPIHSLTGN